MDLSLRSVQEVGACYLRRSVSAMLAALGAVGLVVCVVGCGNSAGVGQNAPGPANATNTSHGASVGGDSVPAPGAPMGGDAVPAPSAPVAGPASPSTDITGPISPSPAFIPPTATPTQTPSPTASPAPAAS
jgi:hypothetical protein